MKPTTEQIAWVVKIGSGYSGKRDVMFAEKYKRVPLLIQAEVFRLKKDAEVDRKDIKQRGNWEDEKITVQKITIEEVKE